MPLTFPDETITVRGPFWQADVDVVRIEPDADAWSFRHLFLEANPRQVSNKALLAPAAALVLCQARAVRVEPGGKSYRWSRPSSVKPIQGPLPPAEIRKKVIAGELSLLLLQIDYLDPAAAPPATKTTRAGAAKAAKAAKTSARAAAPPPEVTLLAGEISLDVLSPATSARKKLYRALTLEEAPLAGRNASGPARLAAALAVHASGLSIFGRIALPWEPDVAPRVAAPFLLARELPAPAADVAATAARFRLTVERERLTADERSAIALAWQGLCRAVNPDNPQLDATAQRGPSWVTLEVTNPRGVPRIYWPIAAWQDAPAALPLHVDRDELNLLFSDSSPYDGRRPATSLARALPDDVSIERKAGSVELRADAGTRTDAKDLRYRATRAGSDWSETFSVTAVTTAFSPVEVPRAVRGLQRLPAPTWAPATPPRPLERPLMWAFMRLEDGWAQLPIPNLTEQMYLDAGLAHEPRESPPALLQGAVAHGNDRESDRAAGRGQQSWSLTLTDAAAVSGAWMLARTSEGLRLTDVAVSVLRPELLVTGLCWLATESPRAEDALPDLEDWAGGLVPLVLRTTDPEDVFPALATVTIEELAFSLWRSPGGGAAVSAALGNWSVTWGADAARLMAMVDVGLLPPKLYEEMLPLVWRRHPALPLVQALPLTQSRTPPNHPSASRQLAPFELAVKPLTVAKNRQLPVPDGWRFGVEGPAGAAAWPACQSRPLLPAREWTARADLTMAALSLPGLVLDPRPVASGLPPEAGLGLGAQLRFDLPYTDEVQALAQLKRTAREAGQAPPQPAAPLPAAPLARDSFAEHWRRLAGLATLAAADGVGVLAAGASGAPAAVRALVEPLPWLVRPELVTASYPGALTLTDHAAPAGALRLEGEAALAGISGRFVEAGGALRLDGGGEAQPAYMVTAGSMAAHADPVRGFRDQRGLYRKATRQTGAAAESLLRTPVKLHEAAAELELVSTLAPVALSPGAGGPGWRLWFRDLPFAGASGFVRRNVRSPQAEDVNDPEASARARNHLTGYEWRLGSGEDPAHPERFTIHGLTFHPLTLEAVTPGADQRLDAVEIVGRLQLPLAGGGEIEELGNAVRLRFARGASGLALEKLSIEPSPEGAPAEIEWPLALVGGEVGDAPRLTFGQITLAADGVVVTGGRLSFLLLDQEWTVPLPAPLRFAGGDVSQRLVADAPAVAEALLPRALDLRVQLAAPFRHELAVTVGVRLGRALAPQPLAPRARPLVWRERGPAPPATPPGARRTAFSADVRWNLLPRDRPRVVWDAGALFDDLPLVVEEPDARLVVREGALELAWRQYQRPPGAGGTAGTAGARLQLLPGMHLAGEGEGGQPAREAPGFAALTFDVVAPAAGVADVPTLRLRTAFVEALLFCRWGEFLQTEVLADAPTRVAVYGSSAGDLVVGYTGEARAGAWREGLLLNGLVEVKDLISFPAALAYDEAKNQLALPAATGPVDHVRHTARVLFNQHLVPPEAIDVSAGALLFALAPGRSWQFLAVVEHQLVEVAPAAAAPRARGDRRWTALQKVRLLSPAVFKASLLSFRKDNLHVLNEEADLRPAGDVLSGELGAALRALLAEGSSPALDTLAPDTLLVDAGAVHWVAQRPLAAGAPTSLQFLPNGVQQAILSMPDDYGPTDPKEPRWRLLTMPLFGRLQDRALDGLESPPGVALKPLQVDPVLHLLGRSDPNAASDKLTLALTGFARSAPVTLTFAGADAAEARSFARLDPLSLEESWFRLQHPAREPRAEGLQSVLVALPDTPARLSRPAALEQLIDSARRSWPPTAGDGAAVSGGGGGGGPARRPRDLVVVHNRQPDGPSGAPSGGWLATAFQLASGGFLKTAPGAAPVRFAAATALSTGAAAGAVPVSVAVSPYLGLGFQPAPVADQRRFRLAVFELLTLDRASGALRPAASHVWEGSDPAQALAAALDWADETHRRLTPGSPVAVLRLREVHETATAGGAGAAVLTTSYRFALVPDIAGLERLSRRVLKLRSSPRALRFREGQHGGAVLPDALRPFELAPPQVTGVEPLHLTERPAAATAAASLWPWGLSALRTTVQYSEGKVGAVGATVTAGAGNGANGGKGSNGDARGPALWWQALAAPVQFRAAAPGAGPTAGLPALYRAPAIKALLPVVRPPLPALEAGSLLHEARAGGEPRAWQPVLPGSVRHTLVGLRPGALVALRPFLLRQALPDGPGGAAATGDLSGSVPVQHRIPRPVALPANRAGDRAQHLQTWASWFEPEAGALVTASPADEAFMTEADGQTAYRLRAVLEAPTGGAIPAGWAGELQFAFTSSGPVDDWTIAVAATVEGKTFAYGPSEPAGDRVRFRPTPEQAEEIAARLAPGAVVTVEARVGRQGGMAGFFQTLTFPLRMAREGALALPLRPVFVHFEDPEYNRRLASTTKRAAQVVSTMSGSGPTAQKALRLATLATDRAEYDPAGRLALRFDWDAGPPVADGRLRFQLRGTGGVARPLQLRAGGRLHDSVPLPAATLLQVGLEDLREGQQPVVLSAGEAITLQLTLEATATVIETSHVFLDVTISDQPVTPVPQAAYALLRGEAVPGEDPHVECARFAWAPEPARVDLVCPDDLRTEVVRRRAVFHWTDTVRTHRTHRHAIQKIATTGSTHIPPAQMLLPPLKEVPP